jgi:hypothetical protein
MDNVQKDNQCISFLVFISFDFPSTDNWYVLIHVLKRSWTIPSCSYGWQKSVGRILNYILSGRLLMVKSG